MKLDHDLHLKNKSGPLGFLMMHSYVNESP